MDTSFAALLVRYRVAAGRTQEALAERAGVSAAAISALERGARRFPQRHTVEAIADALELTDEQREAFAASTQRRTRSRPPRGPSASRPRQLPAAIADFTGRANQVRMLTDLLTTAPANTMATVAITGMGGVGKTALAVHVAHAVTEPFPDGHLYLDLRGYGPEERMTTIDALGYLLRAVGTPADEIPLDLDEAAARYRTAVASRRLLVVLDNAADPAHVLPLLPGTAGAAVLVTSRRSMATLPGAHHLRLDVFSESEGLCLLRALAGDARVDAEQEAAGDVIRSCGSLPLGIRMAGARLADRPHWPISHLARRLRDEHKRLDELERDDSGVRTSFAVSIDQLIESPDPGDRAAARAFAVLGLVDGPDTSLLIASRLLDVPEGESESILDRLIDLHLLDATDPGWYRLHDLLRAYARGRAMDTIAEADRAAALTRVLNLYVAVAWRVGAMAQPGGTRHSWADARWAADAPEFRDTAEALIWLEDHRPHFVAAAQHAIGTPGVPTDLSVRLAAGLIWFYLRRRHWSEWSQVVQQALAVAAAGPDRTAEALLRSDLGLALSASAESGHGSHDEAVEQLRRACEAFHRLGDRRRESMCLVNLTLALESAGQPEEAIECGLRGLRLARELGDIHRQASLCGNLGIAYGRIGDRQRQLAFLEEGLVLVQQTGNDHSLAEAYKLRADAYRETGRPDQALHDLHKSVGIYRRAGDPIGSANALDAMGTLHVGLGNHSEGIAHLRAAIAIAEVYEEDRRCEAMTRYHLARALMATGQRDEAERQVRTALDLYRSMGLPAEEAHDLLGEIRLSDAGGGGFRGEPGGQ